MRVDFIGPLSKSRGNTKYILIVVDMYTKHVLLYPLHATTTSKWQRYSVLNEMLDKFFWNKQHPNSSLTRLQQQVNLAKRCIENIKCCLQTYYAHNHKKWADLVPAIVKFLNEVYHETTGLTPNELQHSKKNVHFWNDIIINLLMPENQ